MILAIGFALCLAIGTFGASWAGRFTTTQPVQSLDTEEKKPMATTTHDDLEVCDDCAQCLANGGWDGPDCEHGNDNDHALAMVAEWAGDVMRLVLACSDCEEECASFSRARCDGCGSQLAGARHKAVAFSH